ncbi:MAG: ABC transporter permease [bacterium]|nr:ABC transporter permease [bacterium]
MILTPIEIKDAILMALQSLRGSKFRSALTILGVMIGVSSVIGLASIINGLDGAFNEEIDNSGSNSIFVQRFAFDVDWDDLTDEERNRPWITVDDAIAIQENCPHVSGVSPENHYYERGGNIAKYKNRKANRPSIKGCWPQFLKVNNAAVKMGRFISDLDVQYRRFTCVLGSDITDVLFDGENPLGKEIRVNNVRMEVVGVLDKKESNLDDNSYNNMIFIPLSTKDKLYSWDKALSLMVQADSYENIEIAKQEIIGALRISRNVPFNKPNNFALSTQDNLKEFVGDITKYIYIAMIVITSVGLMVGGIGVMNIMLVSVTERTREIGVRKAIGAKRSNIILQFLTEAMTLSAAGGVIGILSGILLGVVVNAMLGFPLSLPTFWIVLGFIVSVSVGLVSGIYPAYKAALLDPIEALRYE